MYRSGPRSCGLDATLDPTPRDSAPVTAVAGVRAVVPQDEVAVRRHADRAGQRAAVHGGAAQLDVGLVLRLAVDDHTAVLRDGDALSRSRDDALDEAGTVGGLADRPLARLRRPSAYAADRQARVGRREQRDDVPDGGTHRVVGIGVDPYDLTRPDRRLHRLLHRADLLVRHAPREGGDEREQAYERQAGSHDGP